MPIFYEEVVVGVQEDPLVLIEALKKHINRGGDLTNLGVTQDYTNKRFHLLILSDKNNPQEFFNKAREKAIMQ